MLLQKCTQKTLVVAKKKKTKKWLQIGVCWVRNQTLNFYSTKHQYIQDTNGTRLVFFSAPLFGHGHITAEPIENMRNLYHTYWNSLALQIIGNM